jgi:competence protein ComEC
VGLGLGTGLLIGARTASNGTFWVIALALVAGVALATLLPSNARAFFACLLTGMFIGWGVGELRTGAQDPAWVVPPESGIAGVVVTDPRVSPGGTRAVVQWETGDGYEVQTLTFFPLPDVVGRGDRVEVAGRVGLASNDPMVFADSVRVVRRANGVELRRRAVRNYTADSMVKHIPGSAGSLTLGLLIGDDTGLSGAERQDLRASGLAHVTAVSGWNVSVVVITVGAVFRAFGARRWRWLAVQLVLLSGYVWIVGLEPPIVRAAIMGSVALIALQLGRPAHLVTLLIITAGMMASLNPDVINSLSFQLSFLAMVGLAVAARICSDVEGWRAVIVTPTVAAATAGIATAPLLAASFGSLPLMTVPANMLAGPLIPFATFAGMSVVASSWVSPVAEASGWLAWCVASIVLFISRTFASVPGGHHEFRPLDGSVVLVIYVALGILVTSAFPEGRMLYRRFAAWMAMEPAVAAVTTIAIVGVLVAGVVIG